MGVTMYAVVLAVVGGTRMSTYIRNTLARFDIGVEHTGAAQKFKFRATQNVGFRAAPDGDPSQPICAQTTGAQNR